MLGSIKSITYSTKYFYVKHQQHKLLNKTRNGFRVLNCNSGEYQWSSYLSRRNNLEFAIADAADGALKKIEGGDPELAIVFLSSYFCGDYDKLLDQIISKVPSVQVLVGCSGFGVVGMNTGGPQELEQEAALSLTLAKFPNTVQVATAFVNDLNLPDMDARPEEWSKVFGLQQQESPSSFVILSDVTFRNLQNLLRGIDFAFPGASKVGGLVSQAAVNQPRMLFMWEKGNEQHEEAKGCFFDGAVCLYFTGDITMELMIAQGCRQLSENVWSVVKMDDRSLVSEVVDESGRVVTPLQALQLELQQYNEQELKQISANLMVSVALDPFKENLELNDLVVRQIVGVAPQTQAIAIGDSEVKLGTRFKFVARDLIGAQQDIENHCLDFKRKELQASMEGKQSLPPLGTLMFNCNGRGMGLYGTPNYDSKMISQFIPVPISGFQCNGEIGQLGNTTWLHGFTCAVGVFKAGRTEESVSEQTTQSTSDQKKDE